MSRVRELVVAAHAAPTVAVTTIMTLFAFGIGWRGPSLALVAVTVLIGQLSIGWSNDAADAGRDAAAGRQDKPTVYGQVTTRTLWEGAWVAVVVASVLSWVVAGPVGGSFHVFALAMAWLYNVALSRTVWSWLPYVLAFGSFPLFLHVGLDGDPGPWWTPVVFGLVAVSAHLANALRDLDADRAAGIDGLVVRLGARTSTTLCWVLLGLGTAILAVVAVRESYGGWVAPVLVGGFVAAVVYGTASRARGAMFTALLLVAALDVLALTVAPLL